MFFILALWVSQGLSIMSVTFYKAQSSWRVRLSYKLTYKLLILWNVVNVCPQGRVDLITSWSFGSSLSNRQLWHSAVEAAVSFHLNANLVRAAKGTGTLAMLFQALIWKVRLDWSSWFLLWNRASISLSVLIVSNWWGLSTRNGAAPVTRKACL